MGGRRHKASKAGMRASAHLMLRSWLQELRRTQASCTYRSCLGCGRGEGRERSQQVSCAAPGHPAVIQPARQHVRQPLTMVRARMRCPGSTSGEAAPGRPQTQQQA